MSLPPDTSPMAARGARPKVRGIPIALAITGGLVLIAATAFSAALLMLFVSRANTLELSAQNADLTIGALAERVETHLDAPRAAVAYLGQRIESGMVPHRNGPALLDALELAIAAAPQITGIAFIAADGTVQRVLRGLETHRDSRNWADDPETRAELAKAKTTRGPYWGDFFHAEGRDTSLLNLRLGLRDRDGFLGMLVAVVAVDELSAFLAQPNQAWGRNAFILQGRDRVVAHPNLVSGFPGTGPDEPLPALSAIGDPVLRALFDPARARDRESFPLAGGTALVLDLDGETYIGIFRDLPGYGDVPYIVGAYFTEEEVGAQFARLEVVTPVAAALLLAGLIGGLWMARGLIRPIDQLSHLAEKIEMLEVSPADRLPQGLFRETNIAIDAANRVVTVLIWMQSYLPRALVRRLMREVGEEGVRSEERQVTVLFTDIEGFTELVEHMTPAEVQTLLNRHFSLIVACVEDQGGTVDKFIGDGVMAFWGAPDDQDDQAARALRAVREIGAALETDNAGRAAHGLKPIRLRLGVHSGPAVVGNIGATERLNYTIVGDTVNIAQRLEQAARDLRPDGEAFVALVSAATVARAGHPPDGLKLDPAVTVEARGRHGGVDAYRALTHRPRGPRRSAG